MKEKMQIENNILALSNDIAAYPPTNLSMHEWQALIVLSSVINSKERPILGIDDIQEIAKQRGLETKEEQNQLLNDLVTAQNRYEMTHEEFFSHYDGDAPLTRKTKHDLLKAMEGLSTKSIVTANDDDLFASFSWFDGIINDKKNKLIKYFLGQVSKRLLMGLDKNFLQMMARISVNEAKKYDIPIFLHLKSRLHHKQKSFSFREPLDVWKRRFGHDQIPSYKAWKDYERRILTPAEKYSLKSGDIGYSFKGISMKGRKVTHISCTIWRIGNIHLGRLKTGKKDEELLNDRRKGWEEVQQSMTLEQCKGYDFLKSKEINHAFLLEECLVHKCLKHEVIRGYEDIFLRLLWQRFSLATKATKKAGAFVTWWRRGKLTEADHYWATLDKLSKKKAKIEQKERDERKRSATMPKADYLAEQAEEQANPPISVEKKGTDKKKKEGFTAIKVSMPKTTMKNAAAFDYDVFKVEYKEAYQKIENSIFEQMVALYGTTKTTGADIDPTKMREVEKKVQEILPQRCEIWYKENILKTKK